MYLDKDGGLNEVKIIFHIVLVLLAIVIVTGSFGTVEAGSRGIKTRFNAVVDTLDPGLYFKIPFCTDYLLLL